MKTTFSWFFIILGLFSLLLTAFLLWQRHNPQRLSFNIKSLAPQVLNQQNRQMPAKIIMEDLGINLPVYPVNLQNGKWETATKGVSFLIPSATPGEKGNSIFYGHNWPNILGNLKSAKSGQEMQIVFQDETIKNFIIEDISIVTPDQTHVLSQTEDARLTLYTCTGFLDRKRLVITAIPTANNIPKTILRQ